MLFSANSAEMVNRLNDYDLKLFVYDVMVKLSGDNAGAIRELSPAQYGAIAAAVVRMAASGLLAELIRRRYAAGNQDGLAALSLALYSHGYTLRDNSASLRLDCQAAHGVLSGMMRAYEAGARGRCFGSDIR